jgi:predicted nucleic acid-binding protein
VGGFEVTLVDTSSWVEYLRELDSKASERVEVLLLAGEAAWCEMTLFELWNGVRGAREKRELAELEQEITLLPIHSPIWQTACKLACRCRDSGLKVPANDILIAACAASHAVELEHCDAHFDKILPVAAKLSPGR